jgi:hypothetical protein
VKNRAAFEIERAGGVVGQGRTANIQQQKKDVAQATTGEAGLMVSSATAIEKGDKLVFRT